MNTTDTFRRTITLCIYIFLAMLGLILGLAVIGKFDSGAFISLLGAGVAASLIASGVSGIFALWIIAPQTSRSVEEALRATLGHPVHILSERRYLSQDFFKLAEGGREIDIISLSLNSFVDNTPVNSLLGWIAEGGKRFRIIVLAPESLITERRGIEEGIELPQKIRDNLRRFGNLCAFAEHEKASGRIFKGSLEVRTFDAVPYFSYLRADDWMLLGLYYSHVPGMQSEVIRVQKGDGTIFLKAQGHFEKLWDEPGDGATGRPKGRRICLISAKAIEFHG